MSQKWIAYILILLTLSSIAYFVFFNTNLRFTTQQQNPSAIAIIDFTQPAIEKKMEPDTEFLVKSVRVRDGFIFHVLLENGLWIDARLSRATKDEATNVVVDILRTATMPSMVLQRKVDGFWIVEFYVTIDDKRTSVVDLLKMQELVF